MTLTIWHSGKVWHALRESEVSDKNGEIRKRSRIWAQHHELEPLKAFCRTHGHQPQMADAENEASGRKAEAELRARLDAADETHAVVVIGSCASNESFGS
jgi:hypothetical protein